MADEIYEEARLMNYEVANLEGGVISSRSAKIVQVVRIKEIQNHRNGSWQIVLAVFCIAKEYCLLAFVFGQCSCGTRVAETVSSLITSVVSGRNLFLSSDCLWSVDFRCSFT